MAGVEPVLDRFRVASATVRDALRNCPQERRAMVFELSSILGNGILSIPWLGELLKRLGRLFAVVLQAVSPAIDMDMGSGGPPPNVFSKIFVYAAPLTFFFCYVVSGFLAVRSGTFLTSSTFNGLSFLYDRWNFGIYLVVVPLYVSCAIFLIYIAAISWKRLNSIYSLEAGVSSFWSNSTRIVGFFAISFILAGLYISEYISDLADPKVTTELYWFFTQASTGVRTLNRAGYYYVFLNSVLLFITAMAAFCYIALSIEIFRLGKYIPQVAAAIDPSADVTAKRALLADLESKIQEALDEYAYSYIIAKVLVATYAVNIILWQWSPAGKVSNVNSAVVALAIIGLVFLVVPRLYLNSKWYRLKYAMLRVSSDAEIPGLGEELKPRRFRRLETWLDVLFVFLLFKSITGVLGNSEIISLIESIWS